MTTKHKLINRGDVWIISRRKALLGIPTLFALVVTMVLAIMIVPNLLWTARHRTEIEAATTAWCQRQRANAGMADDELNCPDWTQQLLSAHPWIIRECGHLVTDPIGFDGCLSRAVESFP